MEKITKYVTAIGFIIVSVSIGFYLMIFVPRQAIKKECQTIANEKVDADNRSKLIRLYEPTTYEEYYNQCLKQKGD